ncbi:hypothetical protein [uncultured Sunxiuqinia sp.]|uniref:hypothetical protein n=1 Tax=uncultured Sunxiuqinia sp. TaxID=1573825 RepID=UPI0026335972|nr:hypothetical protein [uncultured Sunxiuqinia sp.]
MKIQLLAFILLLSNAALAQEHEHDHHRHHIGIGVGGSSLLSEYDLALGTHLHYLYRIRPHSPLSVGLGFESVWDEHTHNTITALLNYRILPRLSVNIGPGYSFAKEEDETHKALSGHLEVLYEFTVGEFHIGPMLGFGFEKEESHASLGLHLGLGF